jgi:hypothetical protein
MTALNRNDWYRLARALEVAKTSAAPLHLTPAKECTDCETQVIFAHTFLSYLRIYLFCFVCFVFAQRQHAFGANACFFYLTCADRTKLNRAIDKRYVEVAYKNFKRFIAFLCVIFIVIVVVVVVVVFFVVVFVVAAVVVRCEQMIRSGLLEEVTELLLSGRLPLDSSAARAIGYR